MGRARMEEDLASPLSPLDALGHLHGPHPTQALVRPGQGPGPHPTAPTPAGLPDIAPSQAAGPGTSSGLGRCSELEHLWVWSKSCQVTCMMADLSPDGILPGTVVSKTVSNSEECTARCQLTVGSGRS